MNANPNMRSVLAISDDPNVLAQIKAKLQPADELLVITRPESLREITEDERFRPSNYDLIVCTMKYADPGERAALAKLSGSAQATRLVVLTDDDLPLASARDLLRLGAHDVLPATSASDDIRQTVLAQLRPIEPVPERVEPVSVPAAGTRQGQVISIASARGGMGSTSVAVNLAELLLNPKGLMKKKPTSRVALVDMDLQFGNAGLMLDLEDCGAMMKIVRNSGLPDAAFMRSAMIEHSSGLHVLTASTQAMPLDAISPEQVGAIIDVLRSEFDYVVVDLPQALVLWLDPILKRSQRMFIVTETSVSSIRQCRRLIDLYTEDNMTLPVEIVVNRESRPLLLSSLHKEAEKVLDRKLAYWLPRDDGATRKAEDSGEPVVLMFRNCRLAKAYGKIASDVMRTTLTPVSA